MDPSRASVLPRYPQSWNRFAYSAANPLKFVDSSGEDLKLVYDFGEAHLSSRQELEIKVNVRAAFLRAGVEVVQSYEAGGSISPRIEKPRDRIVHLTVTDKVVRNLQGAPAYGATKRDSSYSVVSTHLAPAGSAGTILLSNVSAHEAGHGSLALPMRANDQFPVGSILNPEAAEPGTVMEQGVPPDALGEKLRDFSAEDAEALRKALNPPPK